MTAVISHAEPATRLADTDPDIEHLYCCDPNRAWCGADISAAPEYPDGGAREHLDCALCHMANDASAACPCQNEPA